MDLHTRVQGVEQVARSAATNRVVIVLARLGYTVKGIIYVVISFLAILLITGHRAATTDQYGALRAIYHSPLGEGFGRVLMIIMTVGLFGFALWNLIQALFDTDRKGHTATGISIRVGYAGIAIPYGLLGGVAYHVVVTGSSPARDSTDSAQSWTGLLLQQPAGVWLVILVSCVTVGIAIGLCVRAYRATFVRYLHLSSLGPEARKGVILLGRLGNVALGVVFAIIGFFLMIAAINHDPEDAKGLNTALMELLKQPFGSWLLGVVALGLFAYGVYSFVEARYRKVADTY